ncbi:hypothetical protein [Azospirillum endophyticum]
MSLKIAGQLFAGPFPLDETTVRHNHAPAVFVVIAKEGKPWNPIFRVVAVGETGDGIKFHEHPQREEWIAAANGQMPVLYLYAMPRSESSTADRQALVDAIIARYPLPNGIVPISGM